MSTRRSHRPLKRGVFVALLTACVALPLWIGSASAQTPRVKGLKATKIGKIKSSGDGPDLRINTIKVESWKRGKARLELYLGKKGGGQVSGNVEVAWIDGNKRTVLKKSRARFAGGRDGFKYSVSVSVPNDGQRGSLEVRVGDKSTDPKWRDNVKTLSFKGRTDLAFDGRPKVVKRGGGRPNREYVLTVRNLGKKPSAAGCKVVFKVAEKGPEKTIRRSLPALRGGATTEVKVPYHFQSSRNANHNTVKARIECPQDIGSGNNVHRNRLN